MAQDATGIWRQVHDGLRAFIAKRVSSEAEVEDILQEVFLRMHRRLDGLKDPERLVPWVYQITRHAVVDHYRKAARRREVPVGLAGDLDAAQPTAAWLPPGSSRDAGRLREELAGCLRPMIGRLPPSYRQAVTLVELEGLTQQAAATRVGLTLSGMKSRVQRGRQHLKRMLEDCCEIQLDRRRSPLDYTLRDSGCASCGPPPSAKPKPS